MTPTEIAAHLIAQTALSEETMAPLYDYRREKRETGAPVDLESAVLYAAVKCQDASDRLRESLEKTAKDAAKYEAILAKDGPRFGDGGWLPRAENVEALGYVLVARREAFQNVLEAWAAVADRIVATDEDRARAAAEKREQAIQRWASAPLRDLRAAAKSRGLNVGTDKNEIAAAIVDAGITP